MAEQKYENADELFDDMTEAEKAVAEQNKADYEAAVQAIKDEAKANAEQESTGAAEDYEGYQNPTGVEADAVSRLGLNGKLSETSGARGYNAYRNRLAAAKQAETSSGEAADYYAALAALQADADLSSAQADIASYRNSDQWQQAEFDYQKAVDEAEAEAAAETYSSSSYYRGGSDEGEEESSDNKEFSDAYHTTYSLISDLAKDALVSPQSNDFLNTAQVLRALDSAEANGATAEEIEALKQYAISLGFQLL